MILELKEFDSVTEFNGDIKPVLWWMVAQTKTHVIKTLSMLECTTKKHNLDAPFIAQNTPGRSAFNRVERRMAPLSKELAGVILPHDHFGSHFDSQNRTID